MPRATPASNSDTPLPGWREHPTAANAGLHSRITRADWEVMFSALVETLSASARDWLASPGSSGPTGSDAQEHVFQCVADLQHLQRALIEEAVDKPNA